MLSQVIETHNILGSMPEFINSFSFSLPSIEAVEALDSVSKVSIQPTISGLNFTPRTTGEQTVN